MLWYLAVVITLKAAFTPLQFADYLMGLRQRHGNLATTGSWAVFGWILVMTFWISTAVVAWLAAISATI